MSREPLDLLHLGRERVIGAYLLDTSEGPALFDCGPATCVPALKKALRERGLVSEPARDWQPRRRGRARGRAPVSDLVSDQRR